MAVADMDDYAEKLAAPFQVLQATKSPVALVALITSAWASSPFPGSAPTTAAAPTKDTTGAMDPLTRGPNPSANAYVGAATFRYGTAAAPAQGWAVLCDRLSHQGGLDGTVTTAGVTTNLPTAALTRYTDGVGVMVGVEVHGLIGTTPTTITCTYTNQSGDSKTSQPIVIGGTGNRELARLLPINLESGDTGVRAINTSTLAGSTGTAGAFGYTLFRPLAFIPFNQNLTTDFDPLLGGCGQLAEVMDNACLFWLLYTSSSSTPSFTGTVTLIEA